MEIYQRQVESIFGYYEYYDNTENHGAVNDGGGFGRVFKGVFRKYLTPPIEIKLEHGNIVNRQFERTLVDGETVAVKVIFGEHSDKENVLHRMREGVSLQVDSKNVVKMYAFLHKMGTYHEIMEFIEGTDLSEIIGDAIEQKKTLSFEFVYPIIHQVLSGLTAIHNSNAVHRDLDVTNIRISFPLNEVGKVTQNQILPIAGNEVKIIDMGIAHRMDKRGISIPGAKLGKLNYMCPEQIDGKTPEPNWDLYALGMCIYEIFTEHLPFEKGNIEKTTQLIKTEELPRHKNLPEPLYEFLKTATAKNANERFASVDEFRYEWEQLSKRLKKSPLKTPSTTWTSQLGSLNSFYRIGSVLILVTILYLKFCGKIPEDPKLPIAPPEQPKVGLPRNEESQHETLAVPLQPLHREDPKLTKPEVPKKLENQTPDKSQLFKGPKSTKPEVPKKLENQTPDKPQPVEDPKPTKPEMSRESENQRNPCDGEKIASKYEEVKKRFSSSKKEKYYEDVYDATGTAKRLATFDKRGNVIELNTNPESDVKNQMDVFDKNGDGCIDR